MRALLPHTAKKEREDTKASKAAETANDKSTQHGSGPQPASSKPNTVPAAVPASTAPASTALSSTASIVPRSLGQGTNEKAKEV